MRRTDAISVCLALVAALVGCRGLPFSAPFTTSAPLPTAHQMPAQQLVFHSDFDLPADDPRVSDLIAEREDISRTLAMPTSDEQIHIYLFSNAEDYGQYLARQFPSVPPRRAFFVETDTRLAVYAHLSDRVPEDLRHEVAHGYLHASVPAIPLWLDEGLAEYFEVPRGHGGLNRPHVQLLADMMEHTPWQPNLPRLEQLTSAAEMQQADYAEAWAWVYFMLNSEPERRELLTGYLAELRDKGKVEPLSKRLASQQIEPQRTLAEYLVALNADEMTRKY